MTIQLDWVLSSLRGELNDWRSNAEDRRRFTPNDPVADAIDALAARLEEVTKTIERDSEIVTAEVYAALHGVTPQTVRGWCRTGELSHVRSGKKYSILRNAIRKAA